jgi:type II secretory pathway component PulJ
MRVKNLAREQRVWIWGMNTQACGGRKNNILMAGIALIEVLVYLLLFAMVGGLLFQGAVALRMRLSAIDKKTDSLLALSAATDALSRDLRTAPSQQSGWLSLFPDRLCWRTSAMEIAWYKEEARLCRAQKTYNTLKKTWSSQTVSVVATHIAKVSFQPVLSVDTMQSVLKVLYHIEDSRTQSVEGAVAIRNREGI